MEFKEYVGVLRARRAAIVLSIVLFLLAALAVDFVRPDFHTAESRVLVRGSDEVDSLLGIAPGVAVQPDRDLQTHAELLRSPEIAAIVIEKLSLGITPAALTARVVAEPVGSTDILAVRAKDEDPRRAAAVANAFAEVYIANRVAEQRATLKQVKTALAAQREAAADRVAALDKQVRGGKSGAQSERDAAAATLTELDARIERIGTGETLDLAGARVVSSASPERTEKSGGLFGALLIGAALGFAVGVGAAFGAEHFDSRIRTAADVNGAGLNLLGALPAERPTRGSASLTMLREPSSPGSDAYRLVRRALTSGVRGSAERVVAVTSPAGAMNPPVVAANLALAIAQGGDRVTVIDCDLRRSPLQQLFGLQGSAGLSDALAGGRQLAEVSQRPVHQRLTVVAGGTVPAAPSELLGSPRMQQVVREAAANADWVVLSAPPLLETADAASVLEWSDRAVLVLRAKESRREQVTLAADLLGRIGVAGRTDAVLVGVSESGQGLESYLVGVNDDVTVPTGGTVESLRPGEALAR